MRKRINISLDEETIKLLDQAQKLLGVNRSRFIEKLVTDSVPAMNNILASKVPMSQLFQELAKLAEKGEKEDE